MIPTIHPTIKIASGYVAGHSIEFREAAKSELGLQSIVLGAKVLANTALDLILHPQLLANIKEQHAQQVQKQST